MRPAATSFDPDPIRGAGLEPVLDAVAAEVGGARVEDVLLHDGHANDLFEIYFEDGRSLIVKRARVPDAAPSFETARLASALIHSHTDLLAPTHLDAPSMIGGLPVLVYWRIPLPTLGEAWRPLGDDARLRAMRDWGAMTARLHTIRLPGYGSLRRATTGAVSLGEDLEAQAETHLEPTFRPEWPGGVAALAALRRTIPLVQERVGGSDATLVHSDLHMSNVLCEVEEDDARSVGVLDMEAARAGPPEADVARPVVLYGPGFGDLPPRFTTALFEGYGRELDGTVIDFYRAWHLLDIGLHCARRGLHEFASHLAAGAGEIAAGLDRYGSA